MPDPRWLDAKARWDKWQALAKSGHAEDWSDELFQEALRDLVSDARWDEDDGTRFYGGWIDRWVGEAAAYALGQSKRLDAIEPLIRAYEPSRPSDVKWAIVRALEDLPAPHEPTSDQILELDRILWAGGGISGVIRRWMDALPNRRWREMLLDPRTRLSDFALLAIERRGPAARELAEDLFARLSDPSRDPARTVIALSAILTPGEIASRLEPVTLHGPLSENSNIVYGALESFAKTGAWADLARARMEAILERQVAQPEMDGRTCDLIRLTWRRDTVPPRWVGWLRDKARAGSEEVRGNAISTLGMLGIDPKPPPPPPKTHADLPDVLARHARWLQDPATGERADLSRAQLSGAKLDGANLCMADLTGAQLGASHLARANLRGARLCAVKMRAADLRAADLELADLTHAHLEEANMQAAKLIRAELTSADLSGAHLEGADVTGAVLDRANLRGANFSGVDLRAVKSARGAKLNGKTTIDPEKLHPDIELTPEGC
jgi:uncharacterized protein YjbI with pentapeptide repeats